MRSAPLRASPRAPLRDPLHASLRASLARNATTPLPQLRSAARNPLCCAMGATHPRPALRAPRYALRALLRAPLRATHTRSARCALRSALRSARTAQRNASSPMQPTSYYHHPTTHSPANEHPTPTPGSFIGHAPPFCAQVSSRRRRRRRTETRGRDAENARVRERMME